MGSLLLCPPCGWAARDTAGGGAEGADALPGTPSELFAALARGIRPQWRPYFRETVPHSAPDRYKAALSLGAASADCYLAAEARDAQQVRNLLTDMAALEMMLSISRQMSSQRQKLTELAAAGDWKGVRAEIALLMASHAQYLGEQKDELLAELESLGCWVRAFHISAQFCAKQAKPPERTYLNIRVGKRGFTAIRRHRSFASIRLIIWKGWSNPLKAHWPEFRRKFVRISKEYR